MKPGWKTSECLMTLLVHGLTLVVTVLKPQSPAVQIASLCLSALSQLGYKASRTILKLKKDAPSPAEKAA